MNASRVTLEGPWLRFDLGAPSRVLSWALNRPGFVTAERIIWREVRNADLPKDLDVHDWLGAELVRAGEKDSVTFLTSRNIDSYQQAAVQVGPVNAFAVATVGLSNAERVGTRQPPHPLSYGTINVAAQVDLPHTDVGEALGRAVYDTVYAGAVLWKAEQTEH